METFGHGSCQIHGIALREDSSCFMCEKTRRERASMRPGVPRIEIQESEQDPTVTMAFGVIFVLTVAFTVLWFVSPETLSGLF